MHACFNLQRPPDWSAAPAQLHRFIWKPGFNGSTSADYGSTNIALAGDIPETVSFIVVTPSGIS
jgi:hypothetical protein